MTSLKNPRKKMNKTTCQISKAGLSQILPSDRGYQAEEIQKISQSRSKGYKKMIIPNNLRATLIACSVKRIKSSPKVYLTIVKVIVVFLNLLENDFFRYHLFILEGRSAFSNKILFF